VIASEWASSGHLAASAWWGLPVSRAAVMPGVVAELVAVVDLVAVEILVL
jgi:hypothetical protein